MKVMILGGGSNQINLIKKAKEQDDEVILVDYLPECPGKYYADTHLLISTFDTEAIIEAASKYSVDAIITAGTDQPVYSAAAASQALGLRFYINKETAKAVTNKIVMKDIFKNSNIPSVDYRVIDKNFLDSEISTLKFPVVLKPVDSQGQRGIYKLDTIDEVRNRIEDTLSYSREDKALVEEFYCNDEITVNGWVDEGNLTIISVVDRVTIKRDCHIGVCLCHNFPSVHYMAYRREINDITQKIVKAFKIENGPIYFQYLIGEDGIKVNEIAMRIGGAYEGLTIPIIADIDICKMTLDYVKSKEINKESLSNYSIDKNKVFLSTQLLFCKQGTIEHMTPIEDILKIPCVKGAYFEHKPGDKIKSIDNATARVGYFIIDGISFDDMINNVNYVFDAVGIFDCNGDNLIMKYSDYNDKYLF